MSTDKRDVLHSQVTMLAFDQSCYTTLLIQLRAIGPFAFLSLYFKARRRFILTGNFAYFTYAWTTYCESFFLWSGITMTDCGPM